MSATGSRHGGVGPQHTHCGTDVPYTIGAPHHRDPSADRRRIRSGAALLVSLVLTAGACGGDPDAGDPGRFCARLRVLQPVLTDASDPVALVTVYDDLADETPLQIEEDWTAIVELLRAVTSYDPTDDDDVQEVLAHALRSQVAIDTVGRWVRDNCGIELGPISETVPIGGTGDALLSDADSDDTAHTDESDPAGTGSGG